MEIQVTFLVNVEEKDRIMTRMVTRSIDPKLLFGDDYENVGQVNSFFIRLPWEPENPIEFVARPYYWGVK